MTTTDRLTLGSSDPTLSDLDDAERYDRFTQLQLRMPVVWDDMRCDHGDESVVVVPSVSLDRPQGITGAVMQAMEERALFLLLLLRQPRLRMIYVTSMPISEAIVEYYLALLPGVIPSHARSRLTLVSVGDSSPRPLSAKLLERPRVLARIAELIPNAARSHMVPYNTTQLERDVALVFGIPMYGADPRLAELGSKSGCRRLFREVGVPHPLGAENLNSLDDLTSAVVHMRLARPTMAWAIVKLNEGVSGQGNALVDLTDLPAPGDSTERDQVAARVAAMQLESTEVSVDRYLQALQSGGGVVEERVGGVEIRSPSVQLRIVPDGSVELLSTHDQLLGGASGQSYLGCVFPADTAYSRTITEHAVIIAERLAELRVLGRFAVDFVVVREASGEWSAHAIELNLRKGGTTHPFLTLQYLTDGTYDGEEGVFLTPDGVEKHLVATDHLESEQLKGLSAPDLFDIVARHGLHFDHSTETGVVFHMISSLTECGRLGMTAVGNSAEQAWELYQRAERIVLEEAAMALQETALPH